MAKVHMDRVGVHAGDLHAVASGGWTAFGTMNRRFSLYGFGGELLLEANRTGSGVQAHTGEVVRYVYFLGRKMFASVNRGPLRAAVPNRLGSRSEHFPYGELKGAAPPEGDKDHFTTYRRVTGLDYAWNRYYAPSVGRFTTADPYGGSAVVSDPESWNRYAYVGGNPIMFFDPNGLQRECPPGWMCSWFEPPPSRPGPPPPSGVGGGGGGGGGNPNEPTLEAVPVDGPDNAVTPDPFLALTNLRNEDSNRGRRIQAMLDRINRMTVSDACERLLNALGTNGQAFRDHANTVRLFDSAAGHADYAQLFRYTGPAFNFAQNEFADISIHHFMNRNPQVVVRAVATLGGNDIFINNRYWNWSPRSDTFNMATIMHEMVHNLGRQEDGVMIANIGKASIHVPAGRGFSTHIITAAFQGNCR